MKNHKEAITRIDLSPCKRILVSSSIDKTINMWCLKMG